MAATSDWCLIFDCDGTLVDSEPLLADEIATAFTSLGFPFVPDDYLHVYRGTAFLSILNQLQARHGPLPVTTEQAAKAEAEMRVRLLKRMETDMGLIDGAEEALDALADIPHCIASNGPGNKVRLSMQVTGLGRYFGDHLYSGYDLKCWKPDPGMFLKAARDLGSRPEHSIVIDDALVGVNAGLAAGMHTLHFKPHHPDEPTPEGALELYDLRDLPQVVARLMAEMP
ncbi:HAD family hydrolase [Zymobacter sp. IVIA_12111.31 C1]|uniref:HAD family hydrolase n=1 Tax=Zymobacter sp. IVIA_12111.31 C1 TaxID=3394854 RepID=UPI0039C26CC9